MEFGSRTQAVGALLAAGVLVTAGCSSSDKTTATVTGSSAASQAVATTTTIAPAPVNPASIKGVIIAYSDATNACKIAAVDPDSGKVTDIASYSINGCPDALQNNGLGGFNMYFPYSPNFDKIAMPAGNGASIGWTDTSGRTTVVAHPSNPDFGPSVDTLTIIGFDKQGNFYYGANVGGGRNSATTTQFFRISAGSSGPAQPVGTATSSDNFGLLPGGTMGMGAHLALPYTFSGGSNGDSKSVDGCANGGSIDNPGRVVGYTAPYDPDRKGPYFYYKRDGIYKESEYCKMQGQLISAQGPLFDDIVSSPDSSRVAVKANMGDKIYIGDANGNENTVPRSVVAPVGGEGKVWFFLGWK